MYMNNGLGLRIILTQINLISPYLGYCCLRPVAGILSKIVNEYDQEIPQSQTADNPVAQ